VTYRTSILRTVAAGLALGIGCALTCAAQIAVVGELTHEYVVEAGVRYEGRIDIINTADRVVEVSVTQTDYLFFADGSNVYGPPGSVQRSNAPWITLFLPPRLLVEPGATATVFYSIEVPDGSTLAGTYWSVLMVAPVPPPQESTTGIEIQTVLRYGIQVVTHVGDSGARVIQIISRDLVRLETGVVLQLDVQNTGERWVRPNVWVDVYDEQGALIGRFDGERQRIYPGCSVRYRLQFGLLAGGKYKALVVFDNGDDYVWGAQYSLEL
jgi:hypothetical protein